MRQLGNEFDDRGRPRRLASSRVIEQRACGRRNPVTIAMFPSMAACLKTAMTQHWAALLLYGTPDQRTAADFFVLIIELLGFGSMASDPGTLGLRRNRAISLFLDSTRLKKSGCFVCSGAGSIASRNEGILPSQAPYSEPTPKLPTEQRRNSAVALIDPGALDSADRT